MSDWGPLYWLIAALLVGVVLTSVVMPFLRPRPPKPKRPGKQGTVRSGAGSQRRRNPDGVPASVPLVLTKHVKQRMTQRDIPEAWLRGTVANPVRVTPDTKERSRCFEQVFDDTHGNITVRHTVKVWVSDADGWPPRKEAVVKSTAAQRSAAIRIRGDQVGEFIGKGGSGIRRLESSTGSKIHVDDDGRILITADTVETVLRTRAMVVAALR
ncbi:KH domain-containing protein [Nocardioides yefusunii]|uniref:KH domain-containing protein n=1 Tax=Nocardioides yefusunii TaxID=2500546 RepID=A0ABW1QU48_9ACTN|nr:KH domain-containing protein [Nocardioides yefusunii]